MVCVLDGVFLQLVFLDAIDPQSSMLLRQPVNERNVLSLVSIHILHASHPPSRMLWIRTTSTCLFASSKLRKGAHWHRAEESKAWTYVLEARLLPDRFRCANDNRGSHEDGFVGRVPDFGRGQAGNVRLRTLHRHICGTGRHGFFVLHYLQKIQVNFQISECSVLCPTARRWITR